MIEITRCGEKSHYPLILEHNISLFRRWTVTYVETEFAIFCISGQFGRFRVIVSVNVWRLPE